MEHIGNVEHTLFHALTKVYPFVLYEVDGAEEMVYNNL